MSNTSNSIEPRLDPFKREGKAAVYPSWERLKSQDDGQSMSLIARGLLRFGRLLPIRDEVKEGPQRKEHASVEADKLARFIAHFKNNTNTITFNHKRVIEIGAGPGNQTPLIAQLSPDLLVSVEPHPEFVRIAKKICGDYRSVVYILRGVGEHLPLQDNFFDIAILHDIIEHVRDPLAVLNEAKRVLVPGGMALVAFVPWYSPYGGHTWGCFPLPWGHLFYSKRILAEMRSAEVGWHTRDLNATGLYQISLKRFQRMIKRSGFEISSMRYMAVREQSWLVRLPLLRELATAIFAVQLVKRKV